MNEWEKQRNRAEYLKKAYPSGTRIVLNSMGNDPRPVESGTRGTVAVVDDIGTVHCNFDSGRRLGLPCRKEKEELTEAKYATCKNEVDA